MRLCSLNINDEFSYLGVRYSIYSIDPPNISILRLDNPNSQVRELDYIYLITDSSFQPGKLVKKRLSKEVKNQERRYRSLLDSLSPENREKVSKRYEMIKPILTFEKAKNGDFISAITFNDVYKEYLYKSETLEHLSKEKLLLRVSGKFGKSKRTLQRYIDAYWSEENEFEHHGMDGLVSKSILHANHRADTLAIEICHPNKREIILDVIYARLDKAYISIIKRAIENHYLKKRKISIAHLHEIIEVDCHHNGLEAINYDTIYNIITKRLDPQIKERMRKGDRASQIYDPVARGFSNHEAKAPLHIVQIDHTQLDMDVIDEESGVNLGRPYITLGIDVYTRMVWCMHISFEDPSANKVRKAIQHGLFLKRSKEKYNTFNEWDIHGIPAIICLDNGSDFKSAEVKRMIEETLNSEVRYRPVATPRYGGVIERLFRTINKKLIHQLAGTRKSNPDDLGEYDAEKEAIFTLKDIEEILTCYITDVYHHEEHGGLPVEFPTPSSRYYHSCDVTGYPEFVNEEDEEFYKIELLPIKMKSYNRDGIRDGNIYYASHETSQFISKQKNKYKIKYDIDDISSIYIQDPKTYEYIEVPAHSPSADSLKGMSRKTYSILLKTLREQGELNKQQIPGSKDLIKGKALLAEKIKKMMKKNKSVRKKALNAGFTLTPGIQKPKTTMTKTSSKSQLDLLRDRLNFEAEQKKEI